MNRRRWLFLLAVFGVFTFAGLSKFAYVHLDDLAVAFTDAHIFKQLDLKNKPALLLGMNAMRAFDRISIDFASKKVRFVMPGTSMRSTVRLANAGGI